MMRKDYKWFIPTFWAFVLLVACGFSFFLTINVLSQGLFESTLENIRNSNANIGYTELILWFMRILFLLSLSLSGGLYLQRFYLKRESYEAVLIFIWLLGLSSYPWRLLTFKISIVDTQVWTLFFSRFSLFWGLFGFSCLMLTSIIFANRRYIQHIRFFVLAVFFASLIIAWEFPLNCFIVSKRLTLGFALSPTIVITAWFINLFATLSVYWDLYARKSVNEALPMFFATLFIYGGWLILSYANYFIAVFLGGVSMYIGLWLYIRGLSLYYAPWQ